MDYSFVDPWHLFLPREGGHVVSLMGSGGKTSLLMAFAETYRQQGVPVVLTTTTRTEPVPGFPAFDLAALAGLDRAALPPLFFLRDGLAEDGKWRGLSAGAVDSLGGEFPDRVVLVEVDGAAKLPLKIHRPGEPVWPGRTSLAVVVMGAGAVGSFASGVVHRLGRIPCPTLDLLPEGALLTWDHLLALLLGDHGYLAQVPPEVPTVLAVAGMAGVDDGIGLFDFVGRAMQEPRLPLVLFCETGGENPSFRTGCRQEPAHD